MALEISGYTDVYALLGNPVKHSKSPAMYNYSFDKVGIDGVYVVLQAEEEEMATVFNAIRTLGIKGGNLTMPVKTIGAELADELTEPARLIGAVNTFKNVDGHIMGHNTDGMGFVENLKANGYSVEDKKIVIIGVGAAATAISVQSLLDQAAELAIFNIQDKFYQNGEKLVHRLTPEFPEQSITMNDLQDHELLAEKIKEADILINATRVGMNPNSDVSIIEDETLFHPELVVADVVYDPMETKLIQKAKAANVKATFPGIGMLLYQGVAGFEFITEKPMPVEDVKRDIYGI